MKPKFSEQNKSYTNLRDTNLRETHTNLLEKQKVL